MTRVLLLAMVVAGCSSPGPSPDSDQLELLRGFQPETIVRGPDGIAYVGTLTGGGIEVVDLRTHDVRWLVEPRGGGERVIAGLAYDAEREQIIACGAWLSNAMIFDARSGELLSEISAPSGLVNAAAIRGSDVYLTESVHPVLYHATRDASGRFEGAPIVVPLTGAFREVEGLMDANSNGIVAPSGRTDVLIVNSSRGELYRVDPITGVAALVDVAGTDLVGGDGLVLDDAGLWMVLNGEVGRVALFAPAPDLSSAALVQTWTDPRFRSPTSAIHEGASVWVLSSRLLEIFHGHANADDDFGLVRLTYGSS